MVSHTRPETIHIYNYEMLTYKNRKCRHTKETNFVANENVNYVAKANGKSVAKEDGKSEAKEKREICS